MIPFVSRGCTRPLDAVIFAEDLPLCIAPEDLRRHVLLLFRPALARELRGERAHTTSLLVSPPASGVHLVEAGDHGPGVVGSGRFVREGE